MPAEEYIYEEFEKLFLFDPKNDFFEFYAKIWILSKYGNANRNPSLPLKISHPKFLMLLSVLQGFAISEEERAKLIKLHHTAFLDGFYSYCVRIFDVYFEPRLSRRSRGSATALPREQRSISAEWWQSNSERAVQAAMADPLGR